jgi:hypothetical protein
MALNLLKNVSDHMRNELFKKTSSLKECVCNILKIVNNILRFTQNSDKWPGMSSSAQYNNETWRNV